MEGLDLGQTSNPRKMDVLKITDDDDDDDVTFCRFNEYIEVILSIFHNTLLKFI